MPNLPGTNLAAPIVPFTTSDTYPTHEALYGLGGWREVADYTERDAIPELRQSVGMVVYVRLDETFWQLAAVGSPWHLHRDCHGFAGCHGVYRLWCHGLHWSGELHRVLWVHGDTGYTGPAISPATRVTRGILVRSASALSGRPAIAVTRDIPVTQGTPVRPGQGNFTGYTGYTGNIASRFTTSITTGVLTPNVPSYQTMSLGKSFCLLEIQASVPCRVEIYSASSFQVADVSRPATSPPAYGSQTGLILDIVLTGTSTWVLSPCAYGPTAPPFFPEPQFP